MKRPILSAVVGLVLGCGTSYALDASDLMGLSPDQVQGVFQSDQGYNQMILETIRERNRREEYARRNPFANCESKGEVKGASVEEAIELGRKIGGIRYNIWKQLLLLCGGIFTGAGRNANSYLRKPTDCSQFCEEMKQVITYWLNLNQLPPQRHHSIP